MEITHVKINSHDPDATDITLKISLLTQLLQGLIYIFFLSPPQHSETQPLFFI